MWSDLFSSPTTVLMRPNPPNTRDFSVSLTPHSCSVLWSYWCFLQCFTVYPWAYLRPSGTCCIPSSWMHVGIAAPVPARATVLPLSATREPSVILVLLSTVYSFLPKQSSGDRSWKEPEAPSWLFLLIYLPVCLLLELCKSAAFLICTTEAPT